MYRLYEGQNRQHISPDAENANVHQFYYMYHSKLDSWYKLWGGHIIVQITPLQYFGAEKGGVYSGVGLHSEFYSTCTCSF